MSSSNSNVGISLTALGTGTAMANISTTAGNYYDGSTAKLFIAPNCEYTQISTSSGTNNAITLPFDPIVGQTYTIRNDGTSAVLVYPGTSTSSIQSTGASLGAGNALTLPCGDTVQLTCISSNGTLNSASGTNAFNNPANVFHISNQIAPISACFAIAYTANAYTVSSASSGSVILFPSAGAATIITLPAVANGLNYRFISNAGSTHTIAFTSASGNVIYGIGLSPSNATTFHAYAGSGSVTSSAGILQGDSLQFTSDGTNWYVFAYTMANVTWT
jgi:hypothetical protein